MKAKKTPCLQLARSVAHVRLATFNVPGKLITSNLHKYSNLKKSWLERTQDPLHVDGKGIVDLLQWKSATPSCLKLQVCAVHNPVFHQSQLVSFFLPFLPRGKKHIRSLGLKRCLSVPSTEF